VHLGSDIVTHTRPWAAEAWLTSEACVDDQLVSLLAHQRRTRASGRPLCVVMAGDFLDLVGISLTPERESLTTMPTSEEERCGLGSAPDHVVQKVWAIAQRHPRVFHELMLLLADGNQLVLVRGNHDIELHWYAAQHAFVQAVVAHAAAEHRAQLAARISFQPWFFAVEGLFYVEHGHQFDAMCSYGDPLLPTCPRDPRRIRSVPFSVLLRNVARPTRGLSTARYEHGSFGAYFGLLLALGVSGSLRIAVRFARATSRLVGTWLAHVRGDGKRRAHQQKARKARFAAREGMPMTHLTALEALYVRPASHSLPFVLRSLYLDRVMALLGALVCVVSSALLVRYRELWQGLALALPAVLMATYAVLGIDRGISPARGMQRGAARIAELFAARYVIMGHTHQPVLLSLGGGAQYINLGHWGEDDLPEERAQDAATSCTYLHVRLDGDDYRADLLCWDAVRGAAPVHLPRPAGDRPPSPGAPLLGGMPSAQSA
jgi:UDP-2,3-diacylglucosamine pyrophosphatase LpxH